MNVRSMRSEEFDGAIFSILSGGAWKMAEAEQAGFAIDDREGAGFVRSVNGVDFPVSESCAVFDDGWPIDDHLITGETNTAVFPAVTNPSSFARASEMKMEQTATPFIIPDPPVNSLMTHDRHLLKFGSSDDLLGTQIMAEKLLHLRELCGTILSVAPGAREASR
jgi:hypothetical protein